MLQQFALAGEIDAPAAGRSTSARRRTGWPAARPRSSAAPRSARCPLAKAMTLIAAQASTTATMATSAPTLRRHASRPTSSIGSSIAMPASASRTERSRTMPSPLVSCAIAVAITSTPGSTGSNGDGKTSPPPVTVAPITTMRPRKIVARARAVEHGGGAERADAAARTIEGERQRVAEIGRDRSGRQATRRPARSTDHRRWRGRRRAAGTTLRCGRHR